jgi:hypothetical protein
LAKALKDASVPKIHFHDLRHKGNVRAANAGASIRGLMIRMGHSSSRASIISQHSTDERQREVTQKLNDLARGALDDPSGTQRARDQKAALRKIESPGSWPGLLYVWSLGDPNS